MGGIFGGSLGDLVVGGVVTGGGAASHQAWIDIIPLENKNHPAWLFATSKVGAPLAMPTSTQIAKLAGAFQNWIAQAGGSQADMYKVATVMAHNVGGHAIDAGVSRAVLATMMPAFLKAFSDVVPKGIAARPSSDTGLRVIKTPKAPAPPLVSGSTVTAGRPTSTQFWPSPGSSPTGGRELDPSRPAPKTELVSGPVSFLSSKWPFVILGVAVVGVGGYYAYGKFVKGRAPGRA